MCRHHTTVSSFLTLILSIPAVTPASTDITSFGATGDGVSNDTLAFQKAFDSPELDIFVPPGTYLIGPDPLTLPLGTYLHGSGRTSILKVAPGTKTLFHMNADMCIERLHFNGTDVEPGDISDSLLALGPADWPQVAPDNIVIDSVSFTDCDRTCLRTDHNNHVVIRNCDFRNVGAAICLNFSRHVKVTGNTIVEARVHGIQFWGNSHWKRMESENLIFANNYVKNGGSGPIWGTGASRVVMAGNTVDGANDIGLDLEWCTDSVISGNTVRNCQEAAIALFYACRRVSITGNTIINNNEITESESQKTWWVRSGIWLTYLNREVFKDDRGHRDITITGNAIHCAEGERRAIWIGSESDNVVIANNTGKTAGFWYGGEHRKPMQLIQIQEDF